MSKFALVVDDSAIIRRLVSKTLKGIGFETLEASNGKEALEIARKHAELALVITDVNMPIMGGLELIVELRAEPAHMYTPILFLTTESDDRLRNEAIQAGATGWIVKPFHPEKVIAVVARLA